MIIREFTDHKEQLQDFVEGAVNLIMQRLNEKTVQKVRCLYTNEGVEAALFDLLSPLMDLSLIHI